MSVVTYDEKFDTKVNQGAEAILKLRNVPVDQWPSQMDAARSEARIVLLTAKRIDSEG